MVANAPACSWNGATPDGLCPHTGPYLQAAGRRRAPCRRRHRRRRRRRMQACMRFGHCTPGRIRRQLRAAVRRPGPVHRMEFFPCGPRGTCPSPWRGPAALCSARRHGRAWPRRILAILRQAAASSDRMRTACNAARSLGGPADPARVRSPCRVLACTPWPGARSCRRMRRLPVDCRADSGRRALAMCTGGRITAAWPIPHPARAQGCKRVDQAAGGAPAARPKSR